LKFVLDLPEAGSRIKGSSVQRKEIRMRFHIENMTCGGCARSVSKAVKRVNPDARVNVDPVTRTIAVETGASAAAISKALADAGYPASAL
jgi:copper chaperone